MDLPYTAGARCAFPGLAVLQDSLLGHPGRGIDRLALHEGQQFAKFADILCNHPVGLVFGPLFNQENFNCAGQGYAVVNGRLFAILELLFQLAPDGLCIGPRACRCRLLELPTVLKPSQMLAAIAPLVSLVMSVRTICRVTCEYRDGWYGHEPYTIAKLARIQDYLW